MALQNDTSRIQYNGNNSTTNSYVIRFVFFENSHIKCVVTTSAGVDTELTLGSGFNVTGAGNANGGSLTTTTAVPTTSKVTIFRNVPATQTTSYQEGGDFPAASHERALDKLTMIAQQTKRLADRALKVPETQNNPNDLPNAGTGQKLLVSNSGTIGWEDNRNPPPYPAASGAQALVTAGSGAAPSWQTMPNIAIGPITSTGSTAARFVSDRFAETVKVADFGAIGNGIADDSNAIQAAITYAISRGNAVIEFEPKTYNLVSTRPYPVPGQYPISTNRCHMHVSGGTDSTRLIFKGNGARLYTNVGQSNAMGEMLLIASQLHSIDFYDLTFERGPMPREFIPPNDGSVLVAMMPVSTSVIDHVGFYSVSFINGMSFHASNRAYSASKTRRKLKILTTRDCKFLFPYGSCCTYRTLGSGGQMLNLSSWIDVHVAEGCYIDGAVDGKYPPWALPVDGWNYLSAYHTNISNCHFRNVAIEAIVCETPWNIVAQVNGFTQPEVGNTVTLTARSDQDNNNEELYVGQLYLVNDTSRYDGYGRTWAVGVYRLVSWQNPIVAGSTITLRRVADYHAVSPEPASASDNAFPPAGTQFTGQCRLVMLEEYNSASASVTGCTFAGDTILDTDGKTWAFRIDVTNGGSGYTSAPTITVSHGQLTATAVISGGSVTGVNFNYTNFSKYFPDDPPTLTFSGGGGSGATAEVYLADPRCDPAVVITCSGTITNCYFATGWSVKTINPGFEFGKMGPVNIVNNLFYHNPISKVPKVYKRGAVTARAPYSVIANNTFLVDDASRMSEFIAIGKSHQLICNNVFTARFAATGGNTGVAIKTFNSNNDAAWETLVDNNYFHNLHYGIEGLAPCLIGQMRGKFLIQPTNIFSGKSIGSQLFLVTPNGQQKIVSITNDGELQVTQ